MGKSWVAVAVVAGWVVVMLGGCQAGSTIPASGSTGGGPQGLTPNCSDQDKDGFCDQHTGGDDCNDNRGDVHPGAKELCDGIDNNCDGATDEGCATGASSTSPDGVIAQDCSACPSLGQTLDNLRCAIDLCDSTLVREQGYTAPQMMPASWLEQSRAAVARFGSASNDLAPKQNGSYALLSTGHATDPDHEVGLGLRPTTDPFAKDSDRAVYDAVEWTLKLKAPAGARGFRIHYVFFSAEYDEFVGSEYNDKFYIFLEAKSTNNGKRTVVNFTQCRDPDRYHDFVCAAGMNSCEKGKKYCYIAINTAMSECCWYEGCPAGRFTTDLSGTGYSCADAEFVDSSAQGSSTGWLVTEWPVEPGEEFTLIFHVHDTSDEILDSAVLLDKFQFIGKVENQGTTRLPED